jgi:hypothetical protein
MTMPTTSSFRSSVRAAHQLTEGTSGRDGAEGVFFFAGDGLPFPREEVEALAVFPAGFPLDFEEEEGVLSGMFLKYSTNGLFFFFSRAHRYDPALLAQQAMLIYVVIIPVRIAHYRHSVG